MADAAHVALATVAECEAIVSWDSRDIVHPQKIPLYHAVNRENGYNAIQIITPEDLIMSIQEPKSVAEEGRDWLPKDPEWRRAYIAFREKIAAMTPEEERAYWDEADKKAIRRHAEAKRRAAQRRRADAAAGVAPAYAVYAAESHG